MTVKYQDPNFSKSNYWANRNAGLRGQTPKEVREAILTIRKSREAPSKTLQLGSKNNAKTTK